MSLHPGDHRSSRSRSKSPGRARERSRSRSRVDEGPAFATDPRLTNSYADAQSTPQYEIRQPGLSSYATPSYYLTSPAEHQRQRPHPEMEGYTMGGYTDLPPHERPGYISPTAAGAQQQQWNYTATPINNAPPQQPLRTPGGYQQQPSGYQYAQPGGLKYTAQPITSQSAQQYPPTSSAAPRYTSSSVTSPTQNVTAMPLPQQFFPPPPPGPPPSKKAEKYDPNLAYGADNARIVEVKPGGAKYGAPPSPGLAPRMDKLTVGGNRPTLQPIMPGAFPGSEGGMGSGRPPPSPLLEAYHGTYQSLSPMPSPMMRPLNDDLDDIPPLDPREEKKSKKHRHRSSSNVSHGHGSTLSVSLSKKGRERSRSRTRDDRYEKEREKEKGGKRVKIYDAEEDANAILKALSREPDPDPLIDILPALSHDQLMELRNEYKRICKVQGRGVNLAKHIKMKLPGTNFGKICHITALGRWESESYWANYWYQGNSSKRELLIESLMGRPNSEIHEIIDSFKDKRYGDDLMRCMETELKKDKFRMAILTALDAHRQEEGDVWPLEYRNRDVDAMYDAVRAREGGESDILRIVCTRSDAHLRDCLETYKRKYQRNFAKDVLRKSNNLVGEVCAHILNGVINKPARDAMLLYHALTDLMDTGNDRDASRHDRQHRYELLISRLVRLHWDKLHLRKVKLDYREKYGRHIEDDIEDATKGDFREFCLALCDMGLGTGR
ncbi:Annexin A4 [Lasiodiplodia theobromae]|uniref:Annexin A4 n=1 Tax=Lasiodiplodia theobromae TaxID=45133 RepID=A0A5N5DR45_9PEZI|nr:Annexin A4 [Lasiodiplodia theobromae]